MYLKSWGEKMKGFNDINGTDQRVSSYEAKQKYLKL